MKQTWLYVAGMVVLAFGFYAFFPTPSNKMADADPRGFALLELFTSEGCSSCPPAEELAAKIQQESAGKPVYVLAFHVDYWDHQGWKDRYSNAAYSQRQKDYSSWLGTSDIYTPQAVVNGRKEFVGSDERALRGALDKALSTAATALVTLSAGRAGAAGGSGAVGLAVTYSIDGASGGDRLYLAVVEKSDVSKVTGGENGGRTLSHVQIVRSLTAVGGGLATGTATLSVPADFTYDPAKWEVIGFVQNDKTGAVSGANRASL